MDRVERAWALMLFAAFMLPVLCLGMLMGWTVANDEFPRWSMSEYMRDMRAHNQLTQWLSRSPRR